MPPIWSRIDSRVRTPADVSLLSEWYWIKLEPPYWYLRCYCCNQRQYLPWDERQRTKEALSLLTEHGRECAAKNPVTEEKDPAEETFWERRHRELHADDPEEEEEGDAA